MHELQMLVVGLSSVAGAALRALVDPADGLLETGARGFVVLWVLAAFFLAVAASVSGRFPGFVH
jgi:hypothetical protein